MFRAGRIARSIEAAWTAYAQDGSSAVMIAKRAPFASVLPSAASLEEAQAAHRDVSCVLWRADRPLCEGLRRLRSILRPSGKVMLVVDLVPGALGRLGEVVGRSAPLRFSRDEVCEALVLSGYEAPRVWLDAPRLVVASATLPSERDGLDQFFEQPLSA